MTNDLQIYIYSLALADKVEFAIFDHFMLKKIRTQYDIFLDQSITLAKLYSNLLNLNKNISSQVLPCTELSSEERFFLNLS